MYSLILLLAFLTVMISVGVWGMRKTSTLNDFFLVGRKVGPWMSAFAYGTTYFSAVVFIGFAGKQGWGFLHPALLREDLFPPHYTKLHIPIVCLKNIL